MLHDRIYEWIARNNIHFAAKLAVKLAKRSRDLRHRSFMQHPAGCMSPFYSTL